MQKLCYRAVLEQNRELLLRGAGGGGAVSWSNISMLLRHCCNHPWLIKPVEEEALVALEGERSRRPPKTVREKTDPAYWRQVEKELEAADSARYVSRLVGSSGKLVLLDKLLPKLKADGHRVLLFSQFTKLLDLLEDFIDYRGWGYERIDGSVQGKERQASIDRFNDVDSKSFIFMLSTRAGGVGINLTAADTVVMFDADWNPQNDIQAMARCHRIGQTKPVRVYKLCTKGTYEMAMLSAANAKLGLEHAVMRSGDLGQQQLTATGFAKVPERTSAERAGQIESLLRRGAQAR